MWSWVGVGVATIALGFKIFVEWRRYWRRRAVVDTWLSTCPIRYTKQDTFVTFLMCLKRRTDLRYPTRDIRRLILQKYLEFAPSAPSPKEKRALFVENQCHIALFGDVRPAALYVEKSGYNSLHLFIAVHVKGVMRVVVEHKWKRTVKKGKNDWLEEYRKWLKTVTNPQFFSQTNSVRMSLRLGGGNPNACSVYATQDAWLKTFKVWESM